MKRFGFTGARALFGIAALLSFSACAKEALFFVGAHPDDSEGYAATAFLLREKYDIYVIDLTRGELGLGRKGFIDGSTGARRMKEEAAACAFLGATPHFLDEIDGYAAAGQPSVDRLAALIEHFKPVAIFTHWPVDTHVDHVQAAAVTRNAIRKSGWNGESYFFEVCITQTRNYVPLYSVDVTKTLPDKLKMLRKYACQNGNDLLAQANEMRARHRGAAKGVAAVETFTTYDGRRIPGGIIESLAETLPFGPKSAFEGFERPTDMPGAVSMIWTGDRTLVETSGYADLKTKRPISTNDLFWIASNTKAIACALLLLQVDKGLVGLDKPVSDYLPAWKSIRLKDGTKPVRAPTVRDLMGHTSGLAFFPKMPITQWSVSELAAMAATNGLDHPVGQYLYSNWGIDVAMAIVERVTGKPWEVALKEQVLAPLGMNDTTFFPSEKDVATRLAKTYRLDPDHPEKGPQEQTVDQLVYPYDKPGTHAEAGGGLFSTAGDLLAFFRMVADCGCLPDGRTFISAPLMAEWYGVTEASRGRKYTFGMDVDPANCFVRHGGAYATDGAANWKYRTACVFMVQDAMGTPRTNERRRNWETFAGEWLDVKPR